MPARSPARGAGTADHGPVGQESQGGYVMALGIQSNLSAFQGRFHAQQSQNLMSTALRRLSSGLKVNSASEGPAALIISELLRGQIGGLQQASRNSQEAFNVMSIAEGGLQEMTSQLTRMRELALHALNSGITSPGQVSADQAELNANIDAIARTASNTRFGSQNLLNGAQEITFQLEDAADVVNPAGTAFGEIADIPGQTLSLAYAGGADQQAERAVLETDFGGGTTLAEDQSFTLTGETGSRTYSFAAGTEIADVAAAIQNGSASTGVTAYAIRGGTELRLASTEYGSDAFVQAAQETGSAFAAEGASARDAGQDATLTLNGTAVETQGLTLRLASADVTGTVRLNAGDPAATTVAQTGYDQDTLTDAADAREVRFRDFEGGQRLQIGEGAPAANRSVFGLNAMDPANLGRTTVGGTTLNLSDLYSGGEASLAENPEAALRVIDQALADVTSERARIGAYQANTLTTNVNSLQVAIENATATESAIRDANVAEEVTRMVNSEILLKTSLMSIQSANTNAQNVLALLGGGFGA